MWMRLHAAYTNPSDPLSSFSRLAGRLNDPRIQPDALAATLGWSKEEINGLFTGTTLQEIAEGNAVDVLAEACRVARNYERELSSKTLGEKLGLQQSVIEAVFSETRRKALALERNPLVVAAEVARRARRIAKDEGWTLQLAATFVYPFHIRREDTERETLKRIRALQSRRPPDISENLWTWQIVLTPNQSEEHWTKVANAYRVLRSITVSSQMQKRELFDDWKLDYRRYEGDVATEPAEVLLPNDLLDRLNELAAKAGITSGQLSDLLTHFSRPDGAAGIKAAQHNDALAAILGKLRQAAAS